MKATVNDPSAELRPSAAEFANLSQGGRTIPIYPETPADPDTPVPA